MKRNTALSGSSSGLAAILGLDTAVGFLLDREQTIDLSPLVAVSNRGYVWRKVYHRRCA
ncbi:MAG: hypothetical protein PHF00_13740 [Elusimicrobia bacterium]|nr:hypothetical protein [Elusimicrobiota bacterium]